MNSATARLLFLVCALGVLLILGGVYWAASRLPRGEPPAASSPQAPPAIDTKAVAADAVLMERARAEYRGKCALCHGAAAQGGVGPNLTDSYWIHGKGEPETLLTAIQKGFPRQGMPGWGELIDPQTQIALAVYVHSLQGTNPPNPKGPQGVKVQEPPAP